MNGAAVPQPCLGAAQDLLWPAKPKRAAFLGLGIALLASTLLASALIDLSSGLFSGLAFAQVHFPWYFRIESQRDLGDAVLLLAGADPLGEGTTTVPIGFAMIAIASKVKGTIAEIQTAKGTQ
ncbi:MAG: hypothetical protein ACJASV_000416 [Pseudorhodobacter sp.]|jgi:hypothetical protein